MSFHVEGKRRSVQSANYAESITVCTKLQNMKMEEADTSETLISTELRVFISELEISQKIIKDRLVFFFTFLGWGETGHSACQPLFGLLY
jgi:hypothetical protein